MKNLLLVAFLILVLKQSDAQYYYLDIIGTKQTNQQYKLIRTFQYKQIHANSYEGDELSKDFVLEQSISDDGRKILTRSASVGNVESFFISYYQNNKVAKTTDSGINAINTVMYEYDNSGKVLAISSASKDFDGTFTTEEKHIWSYNEKGLPAKMVKVKNRTDTTSVTFAYDETDNVAEEKWTKNNRIIETYYYYYNPKKQLTDIVRFNYKARAMLPDYVFEYDNTGHMIQLMQAQSGSANYLIWKYFYNENGMKQKEIAYNKQKELLGRIEYNYQ